MIGVHGPKKRQQSFVSQNKLPKRFKRPNLLDIVFEKVILSDLGNQPFLWVCAKHTIVGLSVKHFWLAGLAISFQLHIEDVQHYNV